MPTEPGTTSIETDSTDDQPADPRSYGVKLVRGPFVRLEPHPRACADVASMRTLASELDRPLAIDLFCGAGGLSLGLADAGWTVVLGVDKDNDALETHRANHPGLSVNWDLGDPDVIETVAELVADLEIDLVAGGPPCQPFSRAGRSMIRELVRTGRRESHDRRRDLWESFLQVVELSRPRAVLMENVPDMALDRGMVILRTMIERLESWGYGVQAKVVNTGEYGVPQFRQRLILVALREDAGPLLFEFPEPSPDRVTVDNAIGDLPPVEGGWRPSNGTGDDPVATGWSDYGGPVTAFQHRARARVPSEWADKVQDHITRPVREDDAQAFESMDHTTRYSELDESLKRYRDDIFDDKYKRLDPNDVSRTITAHIAKDGYWYIHPTQPRTLSVREAARIQTFRDDIRFAGPPSSAFRQIGNAVPPLLGQVIGEAMMVALNEAEPAGMTTAERASILAAWFDRRADREKLTIPWLAATNRWQVIQAETLGGRSTGRDTRLVWDAVRSLSTPEATLAAQRVLARLATTIGRDVRLDLVLEAAAHLSDDPSPLDPDTATARDLADVAGISTAVADLACRVVPGEVDDPILAIGGVLRVIARITGRPVDLRNRLSDGRIEIAHAVGGGDDSHAAHLALLELAASLCAPSRPDCDRCPAAETCATAATGEVQLSLHRAPLGR